jgi:hypothetical protein
LGFLSPYNLKTAWFFRNKATGFLYFYIENLACHMHLHSIPFSKRISRRQMCALSLYSCGALLFPCDIIKHTASAIQRRSIPSTGEKIPIVGVGTWRTFDAGSNSFPGFVISTLTKLARGCNIIL